MRRPRSRLARTLSQPRTDRSGHFFSITGSCYGGFADAIAYIASDNLSFRHTLKVDDAARIDAVVTVRGNHFT
jgi:hypothetical protein